jgi:hypothetical protein
MPSKNYVFILVLWKQNIFEFCLILENSIPRFKKKHFSVLSLLLQIHKYLTLHLLFQFFYFLTDF